MSIRPSMWFTLSFHVVLSICIFILYISAILVSLPMSVRRNVESKFNFHQTISGQVSLSAPSEKVGELRRRDVKI